MECGKLTAKLRDAVPVCFMVDGKEVKRYKNIEIPDEIKRLPFIDYKLDVPTSGAITFKIHFAPGVLPEVWPEARQRQSRRNPIQLPESTPEQREAIMAEVEAALMAGLERADAEEQPVHEVAEMVAHGAEITAEIKGNELDHYSRGIRRHGDPLWVYRRTTRGAGENHRRIHWPAAGISEAHQHSHTALASIRLTSEER